MQRFRYYDSILAIYVASLLLSNITATKLIAFGPIITDGGALLFPIVYILDDILTEVYGYRYARRAVWTAFGMLFVSVVCLSLVGLAPPAAEYSHQAAYQAVLGFVPRIVAASLLAFVIGSFVNAYILAKLKVKTQGRYLWLRLLGSTVCGTGIDTVVFCLVAFAGQLSANAMVAYIVIGFVFKLLAEVLLLPVTYRVTAVLKRREGIDTYDTTTDFTPFSAALDTPGTSDSSHTT